MPGMNSDLNPASPILVSAFRSALLHQWLIVALIFLLLLIAWGASRTAIFGSMAVAPAPGSAGRWREPRARLLLRVGFGLIWLFDGVLQAQPQMPGGLADQVIQPTSSSSPGWVQHLVNYGVNLWDYHPITAATASVWIQVGIGLWMLFAVRGWSARLAGLTGVGWGLVVWAFGESFGGIFAPGLTVLFGAPGAVLLYALAGALLALPERAWDSPRLGRLLLGGMGVFFLGMTLLQAWPGRGFWQGRAGGQLGSLTSMIASMASTSQPHAIDAIVSGFGNFAIAHGFAVNLVAVIALALIGAGLLTAALRGSARLALLAVVGGAVFCLADWVLIEDFGFFGGLGTDPNSMVPLILLFTAGVPRPHAHPGLVDGGGARQRPGRDRGRRAREQRHGPGRGWQRRHRPHNRNFRNVRRDSAGLSGSAGRRRGNERRRRGNGRRRGIGGHRGCFRDRVRTARGRRRVDRRTRSHRAFRRATRT